VQREERNHPKQHSSLTKAAREGAHEHVARRGVTCATIERDAKRDRLG